MCLCHQRYNIYIGNSMRQNMVEIIKKIQMYIKIGGVKIKKHSREQVVRLETKSCCQLLLLKHQLHETATLLAKLIFGLGTGNFYLPWYISTSFQKTLQKLVDFSQIVLGGTRSKHQQALEPIHRCIESYLRIKIYPQSIF